MIHLTDKQARTIILRVEDCSEGMGDEARSSEEVVIALLKAAGDHYITEPYHTTRRTLGGKRDT